MKVSVQKRASNCSDSLDTFSLLHHRSVLRRNFILRVDECFYLSTGDSFNWNHSSIQTQSTATWVSTVISCISYIRFLLAEYTRWMQSIRISVFFSIPCDIDMKVKSPQAPNLPTKCLLNKTAILLAAKLAAVSTYIFVFSLSAKRNIQTALHNKLIL